MYPLGGVLKCRSSSNRFFHIKNRSAVLYVDEVRVIVHWLWRDKCILLGVF